MSAIQVRVNEYDHVELDLRGDIWELSFDNAEKLANKIKDVILTVSAERRLQELLDEGRELR
jgi:hypothetical protein